MIHELKRLVTGFPPRRPSFDPGSCQVGFEVDKVALGQVFSEYFGTRAGTIGQKWRQYKGLSPL
jgi:hypothetical protein